MKFVKILPLEIAEMFTPLSFAQWIMDDGYFTDDTIILCTDNFTFAETQRLVDMLKAKYGILSGIITQKGKPRLRMYQGSVPLVIELVKEHMHPDFMYKLGR